MRGFIEYDNIFIFVEYKTLNISHFNHKLLIMWFKRYAYAALPEAICCNTK